MAGAEDMTESVQAGIKSMEDQIKEVAAEIKEATQKWENCSPESKEFWRQKEARLGQKEAQLREEKAQLGEEKAHLRRMQEMLLQHQLNPTQQGASSPLQIIEMSPLITCTVFTASSTQPAHTPLMLCHSLILHCLLCSL
jgi:septal ring factor EnvC (AmiA/AmiB activator)